MLKMYFKIFTLMAVMLTAQTAYSAEKIATCKIEADGFFAARHFFGGNTQLMQNLIPQDFVLYDHGFVFEWQLNNFIVPYKNPPVTVPNNHAHQLATGRHDGSGYEVELWTWTGGNRVQIIYTIPGLNTVKGKPKVNYFCDEKPVLAWNNAQKAQVVKVKSSAPVCSNASPNACSDYNICKLGTTRSAGGIRYWNGTTGYTKEAKRRGLSCNVGLAYRVPLKENRGNRVKPYTQRCKVSVPQIKEAQKYLKELELYPYKIDGVAGKGTLAAIKKAKEMLGTKASAGECITSADIKAFDQLAAASRCSAEKLGQCSDVIVCDRATVLREGVRSWNFDEIAYVNRAKDLSLDCKITLDDTPFSQEEAVYYLSQLVDFVTENAGDFDLKFAGEFDKVRPITQGEWSTALSKDFELFRVYIAKFPSFQKHLEDLRLADDAAKQKRIEQLRGALSQDMTILKEWAKANVLDAKAAEIASLDANFGNKSSQDVNALEQLVAEAQRLMSATGIKDGPVQQLTQEVVGGLYDPSSVYIFVNTSGEAANVYKNLQGAFTFEQNSGTYCPTEKLAAFDYYLLRDRIFEAFEGLLSVDQDCSQRTDIFVVKGNELTSDRIFDVIPIGGLTQVSEFSKADRDKAYDQLTFLKEAIQKDVLDGTRVGFGILKTDQTASKVCAIIDGDEMGHHEQLDQYTLLMNALNLQWDGFDKVTTSSEDAFKFLQRGQCDAIYAGSLNLGRLYLAGDIAGVSLDFLPIWISKASVEASQQAYDDSVAASAQSKAKAEQNLEDQAKLDAQAKQSAAELAVVRQRELREANGLRFMVLRDELQDQVFSALEFGYTNPADQPGYIKRYLAQSFVDQTTRYSEYDGIIEDMQTLAAERWEITEQRLDQTDYGEASFNGRSLDALQVELRVASKNRLVGKYREYCRRIHAIIDEDFDMWRKIAVTDCFDEAATSQWKLENAFQSKWIVEPK